MGAMFSGVRCAYVFSPLKNKTPLYIIRSAISSAWNGTARGNLCWGGYRPANRWPSYCPSCAARRHATRWTILPRCCNRCQSSGRRHGLQTRHAQHQRFPVRPAAVYSPAKNRTQSPAKTRRAKPDGWSDSRLPGLAALGFVVATVVPVLCPVSFLRMHSLCPIRAGRCRT